MTPDQEHVAGMAKAALAGLNATLRRLAADNGGVHPLLPIVDDSVVWLTTIADSGTVPGLPTTVDDGSADGPTVDGPAPAVPLSAEIDVRTAAQRLGITEHSVRKRCVAGKLTARKAGGVWLIQSEAVDAA
jgi:hypothetical protein